MTRQLRQPSSSAVADGIGTDVGRGRLPKANRLTNNQPNKGCRWPDRCKADDICWAAEKRDISAEAAR